MAAEQSTDPPAPPSSLSEYPEMILASIEALNDENGSSKYAISKHIEDAHGELAETHSTLLTQHLDEMKQSGQLVMVKNNYMKPDPNAPPRRGRGRPPKPTVPQPPATEEAAPAKTRGRPPKPIDPLAPPRPRGRPPKKMKTATAASPATGGPSRGRGRPPKVKSSAAAPVGC